MDSRRNAILIILSSLASMVSVGGLVAAGKLHELAPGWSVPVSMWMFPLVFVFGNITTEIFGAKAAKWVTWATFISSGIAVFYYWLTVQLPFPPYWTKQEAYEVVLSTTPRIMGASLLAYLIVAYMAIGLMVAMKKLTGGRWLWLRIVVTAVITQYTDSLLFNGLAFLGTIPLSTFLPMCLLSGSIKTVIQLVGIPTSYAIVRLLKEKEHVAV